MAAWLGVTLLIIASSVLPARAATLVHDFYLPMPEAQIRQTFVTLETNVSTTLDSVFSVVVTGQGTVLYYDQWEDGYETDLANPAQSSTKTWGDGNNANGIPPGFVNDPVGLPSGAVLALRNFVTLPRNPSSLLYDARDRMAATKALVVSRAAWATSPGPVLSGAVEVTATLDYGTSYISPVGQNLTNRLFQYVGFMIMAAEDNTSVTIDLDGPGTNVASVVVLNRGESHLVNGGVRIGGSVNSTKPVEVNLVIGRYAGRYATDWFTLYPTSQWGNSYVTPVGTAANGNQTFNYFYNPNSTNITINYITRVGSGSFNVAAGGVTQYQMPQASGARFASSGGANFFALCTAGANPSSESAYDWGFTLLPTDGLTTEAVVGWGPGSSDGTVNGSPVWITPVAATRVYVDFNGDRNGPLTDPNGNKYDTNFNLAALESKTVYDPDKDQTAMRLYTVDGTVISAAWGEDPSVAAAGNPYFDFGTTVLPFPVPVLRKTFTIFNDIGTPGLSIGDTLEYTIELDNRGLLPLGNTVVIDSLPTNMLAYVTNSTTFNSNSIPDGASGTRFPLDETGYTIPVILRGGTSSFTFRVNTIAAGNITNVVSAVGYSLTASAVATPPSGSGSTQCGLNFANAAGTTVVSYAANTNIYVRLTDADANTSSGSAQIVSVVVRNLTSGDIETINLTETGNNTGTFQSIAALPSSVSAGLFQQDGILNAVPSDVLSVSYTDPVYADNCSGTAVIQVPALTKVLYLSGTNSADRNLDRVDPVAAADGTTAQSAELNGSSGGTITVDAVSTNSIETGSFTSLSVSHTTGTGANRLMLVGISFEDDTTAGMAISSVTYSGNALTRIISTNSGEANAQIWRLLNPPSGTTNVVVNVTGAGTEDSMVVGVITFANVDQTTPFGTAVGVAGTSNGSSLNVASAVGELVFDLHAMDDGRITTVGTNQTQRWNRRTESGNDGITGSASTEPGAASVTMSWDFGNDSYAHVAVPIKPATGGGSGTNSTAFTQSPAFCSGFAMPSNSVVSVTNFVTVTSGSLTASPAVTATLRYGATTFLQLTNAVYTSASNWIVWSGTLATNVTVPAGQALTLAVTNNQPGAAFRIDYDSATKPSKIALPTTTIINVDSFAVYDAPYPGGSVVTAPTAGSLLYVRAAVSDPFGAYDITSLDLDIDGPGVVDDISTTLTNAVASASCSKTYEFTWQTGGNPGGFNLSATANEGTEGINDTATTSLTLTFLDLGTPSTTTFTGGDNGPATNAFAANTNVCVRVNDSDQNTNSATIDFVTVTVTCGSGDSETIALAETTTNSGIFTACIPASTSGGAGTNSGTLNAPAGSVLNVEYIDPNDPSDISSASGSVLTPPGVPGVAVSKTLVSPADGQAGVGEGLQFSIQVVNSGSTTLTNVSVTDTFPSANFTFTSASITPNIVGAGTLSWTNLGIFTPGQSVTLTVNFTASAVAASAINSATAAGTGATNTDTASVSITRSALAIAKSILAPTNSPVPIGSNITYRIAVTNTGTVAIPTLPLEDTFSAAQLQFVSATVTPDGTGAGSLLWNDITGAGSLAASNTITIDVTMTVVGSGDPSLNTAKADYAVDANGDAVPSASGNVGITTGAARITGHVYDDPNANGTNDVGEVGLSGVTLELYSDPNADGDPADGALIRLVTTGAAGDYELLNLTTGAFVVVETDLPGYASSFPANNRLALNITGLTTNAGANFFDYIPAVTNYATISGNVWSDTNNNAVLNIGEPGLANVTVELVQDVNTNGLADLGEPGVDNAITDVNGSYTFFNVVPGNYVVVETDLFGHVSTADSQGANDNQIGLTVGNSAVATNNYFLDYFTGNFPGNDLPIAVNDSYTTAEDTTLNVPVSGVLTNDADVDGDTLTAVLVANVTHGTLTLNANGSFAYTPTNNYTGSDTFTYHANDGTTNSGIATVALTITAVNDAPIASNQNVTIPEDTSTNLVLTASDVDSSNLVFAVLSGPAHGTLGVLNTNTGAVTYSPSTNFNGPDSFTFTVFDGSLYATGTVSITVTPFNDPPVAVLDNATTPEDTQVTIHALLNDSDPDNDPLTLVEVLSADGIAVINGTNVLYTPSANFNGTNVMTYSITDGPATNTGVIRVVVTPVNDAPFATNQSVTIPEDTTTNLVLTASDVDNTNIVFAILAGPTSGSLGVLNTNTGAVAYSPNTNYVGGDSFIFTVFDGGLYATGTVSITVTPVNDAPLAFSQSLTNAEDAALAITLTGSDVDGPVTNFVLVSLPAHGMLSGTGANLTYTPTNNYNGPDSFTFTVNDGSLTSAVATVSITVTPVNDIPLADNQNVTIPEDSSTNLVLTASDVDSSNLVIAVLSGPTHGTLGTLNTNTGAVTYSPSNNYVGPDSFTFTVFDGSLYATGTVSITVTPINDAPLANNQSVTIPEDTSTNLVLTASDVDSSNLVFAVLGGPTHGTLGVLNTNTGAVTYSPSNNYAGPDSFTFTVFDGSLYATGSVSITVTPLNDAPLAFSQSVTNNEDTVLPITLAGSDVDGPVTNFVLVSLPAHGALSGSGANLIYTPTNDYNGPDSFTFTVNDGSLTSLVATVSITVLPVNDAPAANDDSYSVFKNLTLNISAPGVLTNDTDVEGGALVSILVANVTHGTLFLSTNGGFTYTPSNNYVGPDSFTYRATDGVSNSAIATVSITVLATNTAPVAVNDSYSANEDTVLNIAVSGVLTNDTDVDGETLTATIVATTTNGILTLNANGSFTYMPDTNFFGVDHFTYRANDAQTNSGIATVTITVNAVNDGPLATNLVVTTPEDTSANLVVAGSDVDNTNLVFAILSTPTHGTLGTLNTNTGAVTYSPSNNYVGPDSFTFTVFDGALYATGTVSITVTPVNDPPIAVNDNATVNEDSTNSIPVLVNDSDPDGNPLLLVSVSATNGTATIVGTNVVFTPSADFFGTNVLTYCIADGAVTNCALITVVVLPVNDGPLANNLSVTIPEDSSTNLIVTASDVDGTNLTFSIVSGPASGGLGVLNTNTGAVTYSPNTNYVGGDSFTFRVFDGSLYATGTVSITVTPINDAPFANSQSVTNLEDTALPIALVGSDVDGPVTNFVLVSLPLHGTLSGSGANVTYTPTNNYNGPDSFTFTVNDGALTSAVATVSITVLPVNDVPVANNDAYSTFKNIALNSSAPGVLTNDTDVEGGALVSILVANVTHGTLFLSTNGGFTYTPSNNYVGSDSFTYFATDGVSNSAIATVTLTILATNSAPVAVNDSYATTEDTVLVVPISGVLTNDTDVDANPLTAAVVVTTTNGTLNLNANGSFQYTPNTNFVGVDTFTYRANDGATNSGIATVTITINAINDAPVATNLSVTIPEDTSTNLVLTASDVDNTNRVFAILVGPVHGTLGVLNTNTGAVTYSPSNNYVGPDGYTFTVFDGSLYATGTVAITVTPVNDPPTPVNDNVTVNEDSTNSIPVLVNDTDPDGNPLTIVSVLTTNGTATINGTNVVYTPATNFFGTNVINYCISDGAVTNCAIITVVVLPVNDAPVAFSQSVTNLEDLALPITLAGSDIDGPVTNFVLVSLPLHGSLSGSGANLTYTPTTNYNGPDSFTFTVNDGSLTSAVATVSITVLPVNDAPVANSQSLTNAEDTALPITLTGSDVDGPVTNFVLVTLPTHGTLTGSGANLTYTPTNNYTGADAFTFTVNDGSLTSSVATVSIVVTPANDAPAANNLSVTISEDTSTNLVVTGSDIDSTNLVYAVLSSPAHGSLGVLNTSSGAVTYSPSNNYFGPDSFTFTVSDGALYATGTVSITVTPVNDAPVAVNDAYSVFQGATLTVSAAGVLTNDTDVESNALSAVFVSNPAHGTLSLSTNGGFIYTPTNTYAGPDSFTYRASDGLSNSSVATVSITVVPQADIAVTKTGPTTVTPGVNFNYTITVTNLGPSTASNVVTFDSLPTNLTFVAASSGGIFSNNLVRWPTVTNFAKGFVTNYTITVTTPTNGSFINIAYSTSTTADPDSANNDGSSSSSRVSTTAAPAAFGVRQGTNVFNPQTGLYEQNVTITNLSGSTVAALQLLVGDIRGTNGVPRTNVWLWNASGTNVDGRRYVQYNSPLDPGSTVTLRLEFYNPARTPFTNSLEVVATMPIPATTNLSGGVAIDVAFADNRVPGEPRFVIEWVSIPGRNYTVIYGPSPTGPWTAATPSVNATANRTQWYDDGPPKTASKPLSNGSRYYRVILNP